MRIELLFRAFNVASVRTPMSSLATKSILPPTPGRA
jgi:hypothetical protein